MIFFADFGRLFFRCTPFTNVDSVVILSFSFFLFFFTSSLILSIKEADKKCFVFVFFRKFSVLNLCTESINIIDVSQFLIHWKWTQLIENYFLQRIFYFSLLIYLYFFLTNWTAIMIVPVDVIYQPTHLCWAC